MSAGRPPISYPRLAKLGSAVCAGCLPCVSLRGYRNDLDRKRPLSRRRLRVCEVAAKPADEHADGVGVAAAGVAGCVRESVLCGGSVQFGDVLLGDDGGEMC